jgi:hypothetical protein
MKNLPNPVAGSPFIALSVLILAVAQLPSSAADFSVVSSGFSFVISSNGVSLGTDPTLTLERGKTYTFSVNTTCGFHPFQIISPGTVMNNNICSGTVTYTVATNATSYTNGYQCSIHFFGGIIHTVPASVGAPPIIRILSLDVSTNLTLQSTGTNTWSVIPEFNTNLATANWAPLTVQSNRFFSGTNETICGRPPGDSVFIRIRSRPN